MTREAALFCVPCKDKGRVQPAHYQSHPPMCRWCWSKQPHPDELRKEREAGKVSQGRARLAAPKKEKAMPKRLDEHIIEKIQADRAKGITVHEIAKSHQVSAATVYNVTKVSKGSGRKGRMRRAAPAPSNGMPTIVATPELCAAIFQTLSLEKQAALLNKLPEL